MAEKAPEHEGPGPFDPEEACGPKPQPSAVPEEHGRPEDPGSQAPVDHPTPPADRGTPPDDQGQGADHKPADAGRPDQPGNSLDHKPSS